MEKHGDAEFACVVMLRQLDARRLHGCDRGDVLHEFADLLRPCKVDAAQRPDEKNGECPEADCAVKVEINTPPACAYFYAEGPFPATEARPPDHHSRECEQEKEGSAYPVDDESGFSHEKEVVNLTYVSEPEPVGLCFTDDVSCYG